MQRDTTFIKAICYHIFIAASIALIIYIHALDIELMCKGAGISLLTMLVSFAIGRHMQKIEDAREASRERRKVRLMAYYRECEYCGCHLDPGEKCDCRDIPLVTYVKVDKEQADEKNKEGRFEKIA